MQRSAHFFPAQCIQSTVWVVVQSDKGEGEQETASQLSPPLIKYLAISERTLSVRSRAPSRGALHCPPSSGCLGAEDEPAAAVVQCATSQE